jgi:hypothetical protein
MTSLSPSGNSTNSITSLPHLDDRTAALTARLCPSTLTVPYSILASANSESMRDVVTIQ